MHGKDNAAFAKAVRFIYNNIDQPIKLEHIAKNTGVSLSSLKRIFSNSINKTPGEFLRYLRMELAFRSLQSRHDTVLEIALSSGFEDQSAFARCFRDTFGYPPTEAKKKYNIINELECVSLDEPDIVELAELHIQCITEQGIYFESAPKAWHILKNRLTPDELDDDSCGIFIGIGHDNPHEGDVLPDKVRYSAGVTLLERDLGIEHHTIAKGQYARFHYIGKPANLGLAYHYIYGKWLEDSKMKIDKMTPAFIAFTNFPDALKEEKILIHVPLTLE